MNVFARNLVRRGAGLSAPKPVRAAIGHQPIAWLSPPLAKPPRTTTAGAPAPSAAAAIPEPGPSTPGMAPESTAVAQPAPPPLKPAIRPLQDPPRTAQEVAHTVLPQPTAGPASESAQSRLFALRQPRAEPPGDASPPPPGRDPRPAVASVPSARLEMRGHSDLGDTTGTGPADDPGPARDGGRTSAVAHPVDVAASDAPPHVPVLPVRDVTPDSPARADSAHDLSVAPVERESPEVSPAAVRPTAPRKPHEKPAASVAERLIVPEPPTVDSIARPPPPEKPAPARTLSTEPAALVQPRVALFPPEGPRGPDPDFVRPRPVHVQIGAIEFRNTQPPPPRRTAHRPPSHGFGEYSQVRNYVIDVST